MSSGTRVHIGLGANLGDRVGQIEAAFTALAALSSDGALIRSPLYETEPMGPIDQPDYVNAVGTFVTVLTPMALLVELQRIEREARRVRTAVRWGPRTLDLDLLRYGELVLDTPDLVLPHPGVTLRAFVLRPLVDLDPALEIPGRGRVDVLLAALDQRGLRALEEPPSSLPSSLPSSPPDEPRSPKN